MTLTFDDVTTAGTTTLAVSGTGPAPPAGYRPGAYYDLSTTTGFTSGVLVCIDYSGHSFADEGAVRLFRRAGGAWTDETVSLDIAANVVCGRAASLGVFAVLGRTARRWPLWTSRPVDTASRRAAPWLCRAAAPTPTATRSRMPGRRPPI